MQTSVNLCKQWGKVCIVNKKIASEVKKQKKKVYIDAKKVCIVAKKSLH
jgi:hypothetical protein